MLLILVSLLGFCLLSIAAGLRRRGSGRPAPVSPFGPAFCRLLLRLLRVRVVAGVGARGAGPRLLVANHVSWIDILVLNSREQLCFLAKREVAGWPVVSAIAEAYGTVFVDRNRRRTIPAANRGLADRMGRGQSVLLFPEGTTHDGTRRGRFLTSHFAVPRDRMAGPRAAPSCAVQGAALAYSDPAAAWVGDAGLLPHLWTILNGPPLDCAVHYGPLRHVAPGYDRKRLGAALADEIEGLLGGTAGAPPPAPDGAGGDGRDAVGSGRFAKVASSARPG